MMNCVREKRQQRNLSREDLAKTVGVTRQTIGLIESGRVTPSTHVALRLAHSLGCAVEELFWEDEIMDLPVIISETPATEPLDVRRVYLAKVRNRVIARPASPRQVISFDSPAQGLLQTLNIADKNQGRVRLLQDESEVTTNVFVSGCDIGLGLWTHSFAKKSGKPMGTWFNVANRQSLAELSKGQTHIAAVHIASRAPQSSPLWPIFPRDHRVFCFADAELGWAVKRGNPLGFSDAQDLTNGNLRIVNREVGAGARDLLDQKLMQAGVSPAQVPGYFHEVHGHYEVADMIQKGLADVGMTHSGAAALYGLTFLPVQLEQCLLVIPEAYLSLPGIQDLMDTLSSDRFRSELAAFAPYDVSHTGDVWLGTDT